MKLGLGLSLANRSGAGGLFIPSAGLSLWLKADAGVSKEPSEYASRIVLSGGYGTGTYNASTVPYWNTSSNNISDYSLGDIYWVSSGGLFYLPVGEAGDAIANIQSYNGITWEPEDGIQYYVSPTISGVTGQFAGANGNYNYNDAPQIIDYFKDASDWHFNIQGSINSYILTAYSSTYESETIATCTNGVWTGHYPETANISGFVAMLPDPNNMPTGSITNSTINLVTSWADQSGNSRNVVQMSGSGYANTSTFGGKSFVSFPNNTYLTNINGIWPNASTIDYGTIIIVARFPSSSSDPAVLFNHGNLYIGRGNDQTYPNGLLATKDNDALIFGDSNLSNNTNYLIGMTFNLDSLALYLNGASNGSGANFENSGNGEFTIGYNGEPFSIAEIVVYNRVLTTQERQKIELYLSNKYEIGLPNINNMFLPELWLKADAGVTTNGSNVTAWADQSGNGNNATAYNDPLLISNELNSNPVISFNGYDQYASFPISLSAETPRTIFVVGKYEDISRSQEGFMALGNSQLNPVWDRGYVFRSGEYSYYYTPGQIIAPTSTIGNYHITTIKHNYQSNSTIGINGSFGSGSTIAHSPANEGLIALRDPTAEEPEYAAANIAEIIIYDRALTTSERQQVEEYLMEKYAICLDTTSSVLMTGWVAGPRTLAPIGYAPYGLETYQYGDEVVRYDGSAWIYANNGLGEIARVYSNQPRPWLATWPAGFTAQKICS
jgi:hypothetical protein